MTPDAPDRSASDSDADTRPTMSVVPAPDREAPYDSPKVRAAQQVALVAILTLTAFEGVGYALCFMGLAIVALVMLEVARFEVIEEQRLEAALAGVFVLAAVAWLRIYDWEYELTAAELHRASPVPLFVGRWREAIPALAIIAALLTPLRRLAWNRLWWRITLGVVCPLPLLFLLTNTGPGRDSSTTETIELGLLAVSGVLLLVGIGLEFRQRGAWRGPAYAMLLTLWLLPSLPQAHLFVPWLGAGGILTLCASSKLGRCVGRLVGERFEARLMRWTVGLVSLCAAGASIGVVAHFLGLLPTTAEPPFADAPRRAAICGAIAAVGGHWGARFAGSMRRRLGAPDREFAVLGTRLGFSRLTEDLLISVPLALQFWVGILEAPYTSPNF